MPENYASEIIKKSITDQKLLNAKSRRKMVWKYLDYYAGDNTVQYIKDRFAAKSFQEVPPSCFNFTKKFIDRISRIYTQGAIRNVNKEYDSLTYKKNFKMKHVEKMTRLIGTIATQIVYNESPYPHFNYVPIYYFDAFFGDDPYTPESIVYPLTMNVNDNSNTDKMEYIYWDKDSYYIYDEDGNVKAEYPNPYGALPFVFTHRENQLTEFFAPGAYDIISANESCNILLTEMNLGLRFHLFGQYSISGLFAEDKISRAGSDEIMVVPEGADVQILSPKANIKDGLDLLRSMLDLTAQNNHLYVTFDEHGADRPSSGIALKIKDLERYEDWQDDIETWRLYEQEFYILEKLIAGANGVKLPEFLGLDFVDPQYPQTIPDQIAQNEFKLAHNLITERDLLLEENKDLTESEAEAIINKNRDINNAAKPKQSPFATLLGKSPGPE